MRRMAHLGVEPDAVHRLRAELDRRRQAEHRLAELYQREQVARIAAETQIESLADSEARYRKLAQFTSFGVWMCDPDGQCIYLSNCILAMTGMTMEQARGFGWTRCLPPEDVEPLLKEWMHCVQTGGQWEHQQRMKDRHGNPHTVLSRAQPVRDPSGRIIHWVGIIIDITARQWAENALRLAEERFRIVAQSVSDVIYEWNVGQGWNVWFGDVDGSLGYQPGEFPRTFEGWVAHLHPDDRDRVVAAVEHTLKTGEFFDEEYRIARKDGTYRIWRDRGRLLYGLQKRLTRWIGSVADVTEQKEAEARLRRRDRELVTLVENAPDVISRYDKQFRHLYVNPAITRATGIPLDRFIGKTNREAGMAEHLWELWESKLREVFQQAQEANLEFTYPSPTGIRHYAARFVPEFAPDGSVESVLAVARDITDLKQALLERLRLAALVENSQDFIKLSQLDGTVMFLNAGGRRLVGLDPAAPPPHSAEFLFPHDRPFLIQTVIPTVLREGRWTGEFNFRHFQTGEPIAMLWDVFRIDDPRTGHPICMATVSRDIRQLKRIEQ
ncbi:MAG: PAS domain-containing protein, partial [Bacillota bacterium]